MREARYPDKFLPRHQGIVDLLRASGPPDVVCLQEFSSDVKVQELFEENFSNEYVRECTEILEIYVRTYAQPPLVRGPRIYIRMRDHLLLEVLISCTAISCQRFLVVHAHLYICAHIKSTKFCSHTVRCPVVLYTVLSSSPIQCVVFQSHTVCCPVVLYTVLSSSPIQCVVL